ncbi:hypothetical protein N566_16985 [Streptomycetaceae bacterium MP113-05]|nr:hypothetical protein N566_16985 [Streptomycetaceae bacterium MP113-05]
MSIRVHIYCDKAIMAAGMSALLKQYDPDMAIETSLQVKLSAVDVGSPDVLLVVSPILTIDDREELARLSLYSKVVLLAQPENTARAFEGLHAGVRAVISVESTVEDLVHVIRTVVSMDALVVPEAARPSLQQYCPPSSSARARDLASNLTPREKEVMSLLTEGRSNAEIARKLSVSEATVRTHVHHILRKLSVNTRAQAVALAYESQLIDEIGRKVHRA